MVSLYDEMSAKLKSGSTLAHRTSARVDLGLVLFGLRNELHALWIAAERCVAEEATAGGAAPDLTELRRAALALRPLFGER